MENKRFVVIDVANDLGNGRRELLDDREGVCATHVSDREALKHMVWLEKEWGKPDFGVFRLSKCEYTDTQIAEARERAGIVVPEGEPVSRVVYEALLKQHKALTERVAVVEGDNADLETERDRYKSENKAKAVELELEYDRLDRIRKITGE